MRHNFIRCGLTGLFIEIFFTGMGALFAHDYSMTGHSSIIMFPIYGSAAFIEPIWRRLCNKPIVLRGLIYTICIYAVEYTSGLLLRTLGICPWDYTGDPTNINGLIRLDFAPFWFVAGLIFERIIILNDLKSKPLSSHKTNCKENASYAPVCEHSVPDTNRTCLYNTHQKDRKCYTAQPHRQCRSNH